MVKLSTSITIYFIFESKKRKIIEYSNGKKQLIFDILHTFQYGIDNSFGKRSVSFSKISEVEATSITLSRRKVSSAICFHTYVRTFHWQTSKDLTICRPYN
jgi:hypothetical protein